MFSCIYLAIKYTYARESVHVYICISVYIRAGVIIYTYALYTHNHISSLTHISISICISIFLCGGWTNKLFNIKANNKNNFLEIYLNANSKVLPVPEGVILLTNFRIQQTRKRECSNIHRDIK